MRLVAALASLAVARANQYLWRVDAAARQVCDAEVDAAARLPPAPETVAWCRRAKASAGVVPGSSWGSLDKAGKGYWMDAECDSAIDGPGKTCGDRWDGEVVRKFVESARVVLKPQRPGDSSITCGQVGWAKTCALRDVVVDFKKMRNGPPKRRPRSRYFPNGKMATRAFDAGFIGTRGAARPDEKLAVLPALEPAPCGDCRCDLKVPGRTLLFGHDSWWNAGHMLADLLEVLTTKWIHGGDPTDPTRQDPVSPAWTFLLVDGLRPGSGNYKDMDQRFYKLYDAAFDRVLRAHDLRNQSVCFEELVTQPTPRIDLYWSHWFSDRRCGFVAPSSLLQRYNLVSRLALARHFKSRHRAAPKMSVLVLDRKAAGTNAGGRALSDVEDLVRALRREAKGLGARFKKGTFDVIALDPASMSLKDQFEAFESTSIVVGVHGAGVPWATSQLPLGTPDCCGVVELFPPGQYSTIRGHGNFARGHGFEFARRDVPANTLGAAAIKAIVNDVMKMAKRLQARPTCVRGEVLDPDLFFKGSRRPDPGGSLADVGQYYHGRDWRPGDPQRHTSPPPLPS